MQVELGNSRGAGARVRSSLSWKPLTRRTTWSLLPNRFVGARFLVLALLGAFAAAGCGHEAKVDFTSVATPPTMEVINPPVRNIVRVVGQPSFIEAYERTAIYPKVTGYIENWKVDIGDKVKKGETLATLFVPELVEDFGTKKATVELDKERVELAKKKVEVADADVKAAQARLQEAKSILEKYHSEVVRWDSEVKRLREVVQRGVVDPQVLLESENQLRSTNAAWEAAKSTVEKAAAELLSDKATLAEAKVDVQVAERDLTVARSEAKWAEAWVGYLTLPAPFDGVVVARNANTWDFVLPATGDSTAMERSPHQNPSGGAPIYVVERTDIVRIFVDIPEQDANYVHIGTKATVLAKAYRDQEIPCTVTRTSWALNVKSRTLRAEIDLPNPGSQLLPGMYAYAKVIIERPGVRALPLAALSYSGDQTFCWKYENGHAVRAETRTGVSDGKWIEVTSLQLSETPDGADPWVPVSGSEQVIVGDISILADGAPVQVAPTTEGTKNASTDATPSPDGAKNGSGASARVLGAEKNRT
jgi:multidrug efflux pump subunit AcrA (membrane-fusion protein)